MSKKIRVTKVKKENVKHFDFSKKPMKPTFLMTLAKWIISWPDLRNREFNFEKVNMEGVKAPYLLLSNHSSMVDFNIMLKATHPEKVNNVMTIEGFRDYTYPLMYSLGVVGTRKFITDTHLIRNIKYSIEVTEKEKAVLIRKEREKSKKNGLYLTYF